MQALVVTPSLDSLLLHIPSNSRAPLGHTTAAGPDPSNQPRLLWLFAAVCAGGGRTGLVQAAWLVTSKGLESQQAADAVMGHAASQGLSRRVDVQALQEFVKAAGEQ